MNRKTHIQAQRARSNPVPAPQLKRVLMLITTLTYGGAETQVVRLATELKLRGLRVAVACLVEPDAWVALLSKEGIDVYSLGMSRGVADLRAIFRLRALIKAFRPDLIHCHMVHANLLGRVTRLFCRIPALICTAHNLRETSEKGGPTWHKELLYRLTDFLADKTTIICQAAFRRYVQVRAVPRNKLEVIGNGVDTHRFRPSEVSRRSARQIRGFNDATFVWLAVGRLVPQKDFTTLLKAAAALPTADFTILVAGSGPLLDNLESERHRLGLDGKVQFLGTHEDILDLYACADGFVMSSGFEGLSAALLESAAMGLPAVVTDVGGNREIVEDGVTGYVVPPNRPGQLSEAMARLMYCAPGARRDLGVAARRYCCKRYQFEKIADQWLDLYLRCLAASPQSTPETPEVVDLVITK